MVALNRKEIRGHPEKVSNINVSIHKHNWEGIKYQSGKYDWDNLG